MFSCNVQVKPKKGKKKVAAAPLAAKKVEAKKTVNPLFEKKPKNFGIGKHTVRFLYFARPAAMSLVLNLCHQTRINSRSGSDADQIAKCMLCE